MMKHTQAKEFCCPKCKSNSGYYTRSKVTLVVYHEPSGEAFDSEILHSEDSPGSSLYCWDCKKPITTYVRKFQEVDE
jgi:hypothetical protein